MKQMKKDLLGYRDIEAKGYGSRTTVWRNIKKGNFPPPDVDDGRGHPRWFPETVEKHKESLESYSPVQPKYLHLSAFHQDFLIHLVYIYCPSSVLFL